MSTFNRPPPLLVTNLAALAATLAACLYVNVLECDKFRIRVKDEIGVVEVKAEVLVILTCTDVCRRVWSFLTNITFHPESQCQAS